MRMWYRQKRKPCTQRSSEALRGHKRYSEVIRGSEWYSGVLKGHQETRGHQRLTTEAKQRPPEATRGHQRPPEACMHTWSDSVPMKPQELRTYPSQRNGGSPMSPPLGSMGSPFANLRRTHTHTRVAQPREGARLGSRAQGRGQIGISNRGKGPDWDLESREGAR